MESGHVIQLVEVGFELAGVAALIIGSLVALVRFLMAAGRGHLPPQAYPELRRGIGRALVLGLEFLVAADIIRSVAVEPSFQSVGVLGLIVLVRTFLSWSLEVEITGEWPWRRAERRSTKQIADGDGEL
jgi:uncharacterized membrane protein